MARRKSLADLAVQRFRISKMGGVTPERLERVNNAYKKYESNIYRNKGIRDINPVSNFLNGSIMKIRSDKVSRRVYMGLSNG